MKSRYARFPAAIVERLNAAVLYVVPNASVIARTARVRVFDPQTHFLRIRQRHRHASRIRAHGDVGDRKRVRRQTPRIRRSFKQAVPRFAPRRDRAAGRNQRQRIRMRRRRRQNLIEALADIADRGIDRATRRFSSDPYLKTPTIPDRVPAVVVNDGAGRFGKLVMICVP